MPKKTKVHAQAPRPAPLKEWKVNDSARTTLLHTTCGGDKKLIQGPIKEIRPCPVTKVPMYKVAGFWFEAYELLLPEPPVSL